jgi:predicted AAA+ superfamily ATPase
MESRYLEAPIDEDLPRKMVLLAGPRQVGKTTVARALLESRTRGVYLNWDRRDDRRDIRAARWPAEPSLVVLDELHKWRGWKRWLKGEYDTHHARTQFLVTGSARLDIYRKGGDSLQGRYHHYRLHPFSVGEVTRRGRLASISPGREIPLERVPPDTLRALLAYGGFPEPFLAQSARTHRRWQHDRLDRVFREDVRDLEALRDLSSIQVLAELLPERVGSPLSLNALREHLEVSHRAASHWMDILERLYYVVRVRPFESSRVRSLRKMPKAYLWDWSQVPGAGPRLENLVAMHLLKLCHFLRDHDGHDAALCYLRDRTGKEVDFLVTLERRPWMAVEVKMSETAVDPSIVYFRDRLRIPHAYQVVLEAHRDFVEDGVRVVPAHAFLGALV